ncbi:response regulator [Colwellia psychrerythraea]|uniref:DNA-binding response regulator, LuxR family n=1 Tax=Colwellia psychrerythraea (strain 34H / ATCC BAA-681) TaxID=167879 RepID=Q483K5_COLP3|nr:response regulator transcription factor [Colwellia psychrerythraea]AAZ28361.1 DNA-binding response regulator, LuxR family [Colwellia psychrerythraea 34H]
MIKAVIVDDHPLFRQGIRLLLESSGNVEVIGDASNAIEGERLIMGKLPDVAVLDIGLVGESGLQLAEKLRARGYKNAIVMVTMHTEVSIFKRAAAIAKVEGYVLKLDAAEDLENAVYRACNGQKFVSPSLAQEMAWMEDDSQKTDSLLTKREEEVLILIADGLGSDAIALRLDLSKRTIDSHRANIRKKLGLTNSVELTRYAIEQGLI